MTPSGRKIHASIVVSLLLLTACGPTRPPPDLLGAAQRQLAEARTAGAQTYAPLELRFAEERLDRAQEAMLKRDYGIASNLAAEASANCELALVKSRLGQARERVDALKQQNAELARTLPEDAARGGER